MWHSPGFVGLVRCEQAARVSANCELCERVFVGTVVVFILLGGVFPTMLSRPGDAPGEHELLSRNIFSAFPCVQGRCATRFLRVSRLGGFLLGILHGWRRCFWMQGVWISTSFLGIFFMFGIVMGFLLSLFSFSSAGFLWCCVSRGIRMLARTRARGLRCVSAAVFGLVPQPVLNLLLDQYCLFRFSFSVWFLRFVSGVLYALSRQLFVSGKGFGIRHCGPRWFQVWFRLQATPFSLRPMFADCCGAFMPSSLRMCFCLDSSMVHVPAAILL